MLLHRLMLSHRPVTRAAELNYIAKWAQVNNPLHNRAKSTKIIFSNWYVWRCLECHLQGCGHSQGSTCNSCLVGIYCCVWQAKTCCVYNHNDPTMAELVDELNQTLFTAVLYNDDQVLHYFLPDRRNHSYCLRTKRHELTLSIKRDSRNFFQRLFMYIKW